MFNSLRKPIENQPLTRQHVERMKEGYILEGILDPDYFRKAIKNHPNADSFAIELEDFRQFKLEQYLADPTRRYLDVAEMVDSPGNSKLGKVLTNLADRLYIRSVF